MMIKQRPTCNVAGVQGSLTRGKLVRDTTDKTRTKLMYALAPTRVAPISSSLDNASEKKRVQNNEEENISSKKQRGNLTR